MTHFYNKTKGIKRELMIEKKWLKCMIVNFYPNNKHEYSIQRLKPDFMYVLAFLFIKRSYRLLRLIFMYAKI